MKTILINGKSVEVAPEVYQRIKKIAAAKKIPFSQAVVFCLEKII